MSDSSMEDVDSEHDEGSECSSNEESHMVSMAPCRYDRGLFNTLNTALSKCSSDILKIISLYARGPRFLLSNRKNIEYESTCVHVCQLSSGDALVLRNTSPLEHGHVFETIEVVSSQTGQADDWNEYGYFLHCTHPKALTCDAATREVFIVDTGGKRASTRRNQVFVFHEDGRLLRSFVVSCVPAHSPSDIGIALAQGEMYLAWDRREVMVVRQSDGTFVRRIGNGHTDTRHAGHTDTHNTDNADTGHARDAGDKKARAGGVAMGNGNGNGNGILRDPISLTINAAKRELYVLECSPERVQVFDLDGAFLRAFSLKAEGEPTANTSAISISLDRIGNILIGDQWCGVVVFTPAGEFVQTFGRNGEKDGELNGVHCVLGDANGLVWVGDGNGRLQAFTY